jgi:hypothetical protein
MQYYHIINELSDVPNSAKPFSGKHVCPFWAHQCADFGGNLPSDVPNSAKPFPRKHVYPFWGHQCTDFGHFGAQLCIFLLEDFCPILFL